MEVLYQNEMQSENACLNTEALGNINRKNFGAVIIK